MKQKQPSQILFIIAGTLTILGSFARLFDLKYAPYLFTVGALLLIFIQGKNAWDNKSADKSQQRFARLGLLTSLMLGVGAYFMITGSNSWVVMVLMYALSSFYQSFRGERKK
jgi:uncharacterized membrane protein YfcA